MWAWIRDEFLQEEELDYEEQLVVQGYEEEEGEITESEDDFSKESIVLISRSKRRWKQAKKVRLRP